MVTVYTYEIELEDLVVLGGEKAESPVSVVIFSREKQGHITRTGNPGARCYESLRALGSQVMVVLPFVLFRVVPFFSTRVPPP